MDDHQLIDHCLTLDCITICYIINKHERHPPISIHNYHTALLSPVGWTNDICNLYPPGSVLRRCVPKNHWWSPNGHNRKTGLDESGWTAEPRGSIGPWFPPWKTDDWSRRHRESKMPQRLWSWISPLQDGDSWSKQSIRRFEVSQDLSVRHFHSNGT